jgi:hypothetical protein
VVAAAALLGSPAGLAVAQHRAIPSDDIVEQTPPLDIRPWQTPDRPKAEVVIREGRMIYGPSPRPPAESRIDRMR